MTTDYVINFQNFQEKPNVKVLIERIGESDTSWFTGSKSDDLCQIPVDFSMENILVSNIATVTKTEFRDMNKDIVISYYGDVTPNLTVEFASPFSMQKKNLHHLDVISKNLSGVALDIVNSGPKNADKIWDLLAGAHVKAIACLHFEEERAEYRIGSHLTRVLMKVDFRPDRNGIAKTSGLILSK